jgi:hypothetical protein
MRIRRYVRAQLFANCCDIELAQLSEQLASVNRDLFGGNSAQFLRRRAAREKDRSSDSLLSLIQIPLRLANPTLNLSQQS